MIKHCWKWKKAMREGKTGIGIITSENRYVMIFSLKYGINKYLYKNNVNGYTKKEIYDYHGFTYFVKICRYFLD